MVLSKSGAGRKPHSFLVSLSPCPPSSAPPFPVHTHTHRGLGGQVFPEPDSRQSNSTPSYFMTMDPLLSKQGGKGSQTTSPQVLTTLGTCNFCLSTDGGRHDTNRNGKKQVSDHGPQMFPKVKPERKGHHSLLPPHAPPGPGGRNETPQTSPDGPKSGS